MPNYRQGFDVYDASTGIEEDISKVVIKDGEVMPGWTDEDIPSVAHDRAVIPGDVNSAVFYLMMADEDLKGHPPQQASGMLQATSRAPTQDDGHCLWEGGEPCAVHR